MAGEIFISYRRTRDGAAAHLEETLREHGFAEYQIFRDVRGLFAGEAFDHQLADTLARTRVVLLLLGPGDAPRVDENDWVTRELRAAMKARRPILPVVLPGGASELATAWPTELRPILEMQSLDFGRKKDGSVRRLVGALRRYGVRPLDAAERWKSILAFSPVERELEALCSSARRSRSGVQLLRGDGGTGRTHVMQKAARDLRRPGDDEAAGVGKAVALHRGLRSRLVGVDGAAMYDWIEGLLSCDADLAMCVLDLRAFGLDPQFLSRSVIDQLDSAQRASLRRGEPSPSRVGMASGSLALLERLALRRPLVLMIDDVDLADSGTQEIVRVLASRLQQPDPPAIHLIIAAANSDLLDLFVAGLGDLEQIELDPDVREMLSRSGHFDATVIDALVERNLTPSQCVVYLRYLHEHDLLLRRGATWNLAPNHTLPTLTEVLDDELDVVLPSGLQQLLELGALCGTRFPAAVADCAAAADDATSGSDGADVAKRLLGYDLDGAIVQPARGRGPDRIGFASSMWWRHLRARRLLPTGAPSDPADVRRLAGALATSIAGSVECYDDWATIGFLYDSIGDNAQAGAAFLKAARAARVDHADEAARRGYLEAARRLALHAMSSPPGADRAGELLRVAYCVFRAATVVSDAADTAHPAPGPTRTAAPMDSAAYACPLGSQQDLLDQADAILVDVDRELDAVDLSTLAIDFDDVVTHGADVNSETAERLKLQWRSLSAFVAVERGRRELADPDPSSAVGSFSRALLLGEAGLSGSLYHELVVAASAGLSLAFSRAVTTAGASEQAAAAFEHASRAAMMIRRSPYASAQAPHEVNRFEQATQWIEAARRELAERLRSPALARPSTTALDDDAITALDEDALLALLAASYQVVAPPGRLDHPGDIVDRCAQLAERAADLAPCRPSRTFMRDAEIYALSHDQFRYTAGARLLRLWRDLGGTDTAKLVRGVENEWHNPVLLHGLIAAHWLEHDICIDRVVGEASSRRIRAALISHTVGAAALDDSPDCCFIRAVHLADLASRGADDPAAQEVWEQAFTPGGLAAAYTRAYTLRAERLRQEGKVVSPITSSLEAELS